MTHANNCQTGLLLEAPTDFFFNRYSVKCPNRLNNSHTMTSQPIRNLFQHGINQVGVFPRLKEGIQLANYPQNSQNMRERSTCVRLEKLFGRKIMPSAKIYIYICIVFVFHRYLNEDNTLFLPIDVGWIDGGSPGRRVLTDGINVAEGGRRD